MNPPIVNQVNYAADVTPQDPPHDRLLTRDEAEALIAQGMRWMILPCAGDRSVEIHSGTGRPGAAGMLRGIPSTAALRRDALRRRQGKASSLSGSRVFAFVDAGPDGLVLVLADEGSPMIYQILERFAGG